MIEDRAAALERRLEAVQYARGARDFVRFTRDPADDAIAGIVKEVAADGEEGCALFRNQPGEDGGTLALHAQRSVVGAYRQLSLSLALEAMDAYALDRSGVDPPWETWVLAALFIARDLGGDVAAISERFTSMAAEATAERFAIATDALTRVDSLEDCRLAEVSTTYGKGLIENPELTDMPGYGLYASPALGRERILFTPSSNLAQLAVDVADSIDGSGHGTSDAIVQDQIPSTLVPGYLTGPYLRTTGCLRFMVESSGESGVVLSSMVYVAELDDEGDAQSWGASAAALEGQWSAWDDRRLVLVSLQPTFDDDQDEVVDLHDFAVIARSALDDRSTW